MSGRSRGNSSSSSSGRSGVSVAGDSSSSGSNSSSSSSANSGSGFSSTFAVDTLTSDASSSMGPSLSGAPMWDFLEEQEGSGDEGEEGGGGVRSFVNNKDAVVFLIDGQAPMHVPKENGEIPFKLALKCAAAILAEKIIATEHDLVGVCIYGCEKKNNSNEFDNVYVLQDLDVPDAHRIIQLEDMGAAGRGNGAEYRDNIGGSVEAGTARLCDALWTCSTMFSAVATKVGTKRIFLFTNDDNPNATDPLLQEQAQQRAQDLYELGIQIELFCVHEKIGGVDKNGIAAGFDVSRFYQDVISYAEDDSADEVQHFHMAEGLESLQKSINQKIFKKRTLGRLPLIIGDNIELGVKLYNIVQEAKKGSFSWLDARTNQPTKTTSKWICEATGSLLMPSQMKYSYPYGDKTIVFEKDELQKIKCFDPPGLRVMGFKPRSKLKQWQNLRSSSFIYPDDSTIRGSVTAFAALFQKMVELDKIAIARFTPRVNTPPKFCALLPQVERVDDDTGDVLIPNGFVVIYLPYLDDYRELDVEDGVVDPSPEQTKLAKKVVKAMTIKFDSRDFPNPAIQRHYASLQALALDREDLGAPEDLIGPDEEGVQQFRDKILEFKESVFPPDYTGAAPKKPAAPRKRKAAGDAEGAPAAKKAATGPLDWWSMSEAQINKCTVAVLKGFLQDEGVPLKSGQRKADLVELAINHIALNPKA